MRGSESEPGLPKLAPRGLGSGRESVLSCRALILCLSLGHRHWHKWLLGTKGTFNGPTDPKSLRGAIFQDSPGSGGDCGMRNQLGLEMGRREKRRRCDAQHPLAGALRGEV